MKKIFMFALVFVMLMSVPAFASVNPFVDLPESHWALSAVQQLSASGVVSGYPDGTFKGNKTATRYEVASVVARALAKVDMEKASKLDVELLKKLVVEFKDELTALGVQVAHLDSRVATLEDNLGGWKLSGMFTFQFDSVGEDNSPYRMTNSKENFKFDKAELHISRYIDEKVSFYAILADDSQDKTQLGNLYWKNFFVDVKLPLGVDGRIGRFTWDWGNYVDNAPWFGDVQKTGFMFTKVFGANAMARVYVNKETEGSQHSDDLMVLNSDVLVYGGKLNFDFERFGLGLQYHTWDFSEVNLGGTDDNIVAYAVDGYFKFGNDVKVFGEYWQQDLDVFWQNGGIDNPSAWRAGFFVPQDILKITNVWVEYNKWDRGFVLQNDPFAKYDSDVVFAVDRTNMSFDSDTVAWFAKLEQKWNDKWSTFGRYVHVSNDNLIEQKVTNWGVGVTNYYTPALSFTLSYDNVQFDNIGQNDDHLIRFETKIIF